MHIDYDVGQDVINVDGGGGGEAIKIKMKGNSTQ